MNLNKIHIGTSGWQYSHWRGTFYPEDLAKNKWFDFYAEKFKTVEINNTFYNLPAKKTFSNWKQSAPSGFTYVLKASRYITHMKKLKDSDEAVDNFLSAADELKSKLGPILFQLPPRWQKNPARLDSFLQSLPKKKKYKYAFEFRDHSWIDEEIKGILQKYQVSFCIYDMPDYTTPLWITSDIVYVRLHGPVGLYQGSYHGNALRSWADRFVQWSKDGYEIYCYFNNDDSGYAPKDALQLINLVKDTK